MLDLPTVIRFFSYMTVFSLISNSFLFRLEAHMSVSLNICYSAKNFSEAIVMLSQLNYYLATNSGPILSLWDAIKSEVEDTSRLRGVAQREQAKISLNNLQVIRC